MPIPDVDATLNDAPPAWLSLAELDAIVTSANNEFIQALGDAAPYAASAVALAFVAGFLWGVDDGAPDADADRPRR